MLLRSTYTYRFLDPPHIIPPLYPPMILLSSTFISITCGQNITLSPSLKDNLKLIVLSCSLYNGSNIVSTEVYKDGTLISESFSIIIENPDFDDFGTYIFIVSSGRCGSAITTAGILPEG